MPVGTTHFGSCLSVARSALSQGRALDLLGAHKYDVVSLDQNPGFSISLQAPKRTLYNRAREFRNFMLPDESVTIFLQIKYTAQND